MPQKTQNLTDTQLVILSAATQRDDGAALPLPKSLKIKGAAVTKTLDSLLKKGLLDEKPAPHDAAAWRKGKDGRRMMLVISDTGLKAIDGETDEKPDARNTKVTKKKNKSRNVVATPSAETGVRPGSKLDAILALLRRRNGASIAEMQASTGWQPHSVRAALTGLRKRGVSIERDKTTDGETVYRAPEG